MKSDIKRYLESFHIYSRPSFWGWKGATNMVFFFLELHNIKPETYKALIVNLIWKSLH